MKVNHCSNQEYKIENIFILAYYYETNTIEYLYFTCVLIFTYFITIE